MVHWHRALALIKKVLSREKKDRIPFSDLFSRFQNILQNNNAAMEIIADMGGKLGGEFVFDKKYIIDSVKELERLVRSGAYDLNFMAHNQYLEVYEAIEGLAKSLELELSGNRVIYEERRIYFLNEIEDGTEDIVGEKAYNLSRLADLPEINIAPGFVVTIKGFRDYLAYNNRFEEIGALLEECKAGRKSLESTSRAIQLLILAGEVPPELRREILMAARQIGKEQAMVASYFAVRSSPVSEAEDLSLAGFYDSFLNVSLDELLSKLKKVFASLYNPQSLEYRRNKGRFHLEMVMPVLYQKMVSSAVSGVLYTLDPNKAERPESLLRSNRGQGTAVVEEGLVDLFRVSRDPPHRLIEHRPGSMARSRGRSKEGENPPLAPEECKRIVETGLILERFFKTPLDIEWCLDHERRLWILQARHLRIRPQRRPQHPELRRIIKAQHVLLAECGMIAYRGVGAGPVRIVTDNEGLDQFPAGAVLVSRYSPPWLAKIIPRASAIVTDIGSPIGHMATVAREFRVPAIVGTGVATKVLKPNQEVTVDAERNMVYEGRVKELLQHELLEKPIFETTQEFQILRRVLKRISPLNLTDPEAPTFTAKGCRTFHDIMRFVHEKAFQALVTVGRDPRSLIRGGGKRLRSDIPLDLLLIDVGGGLAEHDERGPYANPEQITSQPMEALWRGLSSPEIWSTQPIAVDFKGLMSSLTRTQAEDVLGNSQLGVNLAVIGADYVNLILRLGYHFTSVEAAVGPTPENNHISFRFAGGVTDITRRSRRATLLMSILEKAGFKVEKAGDLVNARAVNLGRDQLVEDLYLIGRLIGFTRQLDVQLKHDGDVDLYLEKFLKGLEQPGHKQQEQ